MCVKFNKAKELFGVFFLKKVKGAIISNCPRKSVHSLGAEQENDPSGMVQFRITFNDKTYQQ